MDELKAQSSQWCEQARRLCEPPGDPGSASLLDRLDTIAAGIRLRRQLDGLDPPLESERRDLVRQLALLQVVADGAVEALVQETNGSKEVRARVRLSAQKSEPVCAGVASELSPGPLQQAMVIEGLRGDLDWLTRWSRGWMVKRLDR